MNGETQETAAGNLDRAILEAFPGFVVRKDLSKRVKGNALVPTYVLEYLLGQYCATDDEATIDAGVQKVLEILKDHYVNRNEAGLIRSRIKERGRYRVIDRVEVELNDKRGEYEASFLNLGLKKVDIDAEIVKRHQKLLIGGVWSVVDVEYQLDDSGINSPWSIDALKPIQISSFSFEQYVAGRARFSVEQWIDVLVQSMGFNPEYFGDRDKLHLIVRLIPYCENNYNLIELGPKGTGKSHIYSEFSPHGILISGGEITLAKLFVNNSTGRLGLVGYWDTVAFDEFAGKEKRVDKNLVDVMKNYLANKSFSRGMDTQSGAASFVFVGNTRRSVPYMLKHSDLFDELPSAYHDSAFIDRLHFSLPGWEIPVIRNELFTEGYGFVVDYFAEALRHLRNQDYSGEYREHFELNRGLSARDRTAIEKTVAGLLKILYPARDASRPQIEQLLTFAMEGRKRVYNQLIRMDETFEQRDFFFTDLSRSRQQEVEALEERQHLARSAADNAGDAPASDSESDTTSATAGQPDAQRGVTDPVWSSILPGKHVVVEENQLGISYRKLFGACLAGARSIEVCDPYLRNFHQIKNLSELLQVVLETKPEEEEVTVRVVTRLSDGREEEQDSLLSQVADSVASMGILVSYEIKDDPSMHARFVSTDTGWKISLDRGLDIFQPFDRRDAFNLQNTIQEQRRCRAFEVTYLRVE